MEVGLYDAIAWLIVYGVGAVCIAAGAAVTGATSAKSARRIADGLSLILRPLGAQPIDWARIDKKCGRNAR